LKAEGASEFPGDIIHLHKMLSKYEGTFLTRFTDFLTCSWKDMARNFQGWKKPDSFPLENRVFGFNE
jgi:hypothetical protein